MKINVAKTTERLAGGSGKIAATQSYEGQLRRAVMANLLWEKPAYQDGKLITENISALIPQVAPETVAEIALEARKVQKLKHVPLFIAIEMLKHPEHKPLVGRLLPEIVNRPDFLSETLALYWNNGKTPLANQLKKGLAEAFHNFDEYQLSKWNRSQEIRLRDVMFLVHPKPRNMVEAELWEGLAKDCLKPADTWEVGLSSGENKKDVWTRLMETKKLGANAFLQNLDNITNCGVEDHIIRAYFAIVNPEWLLPVDFFKAVDHNPRYALNIEDLMYRCLRMSKKLKGKTILIVDVSGSMTTLISEKSTYSRRDVAAMMAVLAREVCEDVSIYATAGNDGTKQHKTKKLDDIRGFALARKVSEADKVVGGGGIFTRQCLEYIRPLEPAPERIIVFSDSQDCDWPHSRTPAPFGHYNYIVDVSSNTHGVNYKGIWDAEVSGWSEHFLKFIAALEGVQLGE